MSCASASSEHVSARRSAAARARTRRHRAELMRRCEGAAARTQCGDGGWSGCVAHESSRGGSACWSRAENTSTVDCCPLVEHCQVALLTCLHDHFPVSSSRQLLTASIRTRTVAASSSTSSMMRSPARAERGRIVIWVISSERTVEEGSVDAGSVDDGSRVVDDAVEDVVVADGVGDGSLVIGPIDGVVADVPEPNGWVEGGAAEGGSLDAVEDVVGSSGAGPGCVVLGGAAGSGGLVVGWAIPGPRGVTSLERFRSVPDDPVVVGWTLDWSPRCSLDMTEGAVGSARGLVLVAREDLSLPRLVGASRLVVTAGGSCGVGAVRVASGVVLMTAAAMAAMTRTLAAADEARVVRRDLLPSDHGHRRGALRNARGVIPTSAGTNRLRSSWLTSMISGNRALQRAQRWR